MALSKTSAGRNSPKTKSGRSNLASKSSETRRKSSRSHQASLQAESSWGQDLVWPLYTRDGQTLTTLDDARKFTLSLPDNIGTRNQWQRAIELMFDASEGGDIAAASHQIQKALFLDAMLDVTKTRAE